jgi:hypothetical protein
MARDHGLSQFFRPLHASRQSMTALRLVHMICRSQRIPKIASRSYRTFEKNFVLPIPRATIEDWHCIGSEVHVQNQSVASDSQRITVIVSRSHQTSKLKRTSHASDYYLVRVFEIGQIHRRGRRCTLSPHKHLTPFTNIPRRSAPATLIKQGMRKAALHPIAKSSLSFSTSPSPTWQILPTPVQT